MDLVQWVGEALRSKWESWAWWAQKPYDQAFSGKAFYFVVSADYTNWFVMPSVGETLYDARGRLEGTLRCLGVSRLMEREAGSLQFRIGFPTCPYCGTLMPQADFYFGRRLASWRCGIRECTGSAWTYIAGGHIGKPAVSVHGAGTVMDMAESYGNRRSWEG